MLEHFEPEHHSRCMALIGSRYAPRRRLTVSEWADAYRILSEKTSAEFGPWRTARNPVMREIMDCLSEDSPVQEVWIQKCGQWGATEIALNWIGYIMDHIRSSKPTLVTVPTDGLLARWVTQRLHPMLRECERLRALIMVDRSRDSTNRMDIKDYAGGTLFVRAAGSSSNLKSDSIRFTDLG